jgi:hypothetical protein
MNPNAVCIPAKNVTEDNKDRLCNTCRAGVLGEGFVIGGGEEYYCTKKCLNIAYSPEELEEFGIGEDWSESYWTTWEEDYE